MSKLFSVYSYPSVRKFERECFPKFHWFMSNNKESRKSLKAYFKNYRADEFHALDVLWGKKRGKDTYVYRITSTPK